MPSPALADALTDFASSPAAKSAASLPSGNQQPRSVLSPVPPPPSVEDLVAAQVERVKAVLVEEMEAGHKAALEAEQERHATEIAEVTARFGREAAVLIERRLAEMEARLVELTTSVTARILATTLADDIREQAVGQLAATIRSALADDEAVRVRVRGASSLCQSLETELGELRTQVDFTADEGFDLTVSIDDSIYETRLSEWSAAMSEILE